MSGEALGRSDGGFNAGIGEKHGIGIAREWRVGHVANGESLRAFCASDVQGRNCINRCAGLGDEHCQLMRLYDGIAIAVLAGKVDLHRYAGHALDHEFAGQSCVPAGSAGCDVNLSQLPHLSLADARSRQCNVTGAVHASFNSLPHRFRVAEGVVSLTPRRGFSVIYLTPEELDDLVSVRAGLEVMALRFRGGRAGGYRGGMGQSLA